MTHHGVALDGTSGQVPNPSALLGSYDVYGNIHDHAYKPLGALSYGAGGSPYRLSHAGGAGVFYDANGNMQWQWRASQGGWVEYGWNAANKISYIHNSDTTRQMTFSYDGGGREVTRVLSRSGTTSEKKILLMGYEQSWTQAATAEAPWQLGYTRIFINTPAGVIGTYEWPGAVGGTAPGTRRYFHYDHQGSIAVVTDQWGTVMQRFSYDAFGGRRDAMFWSGRTLSDSVGSHEGSGDLGYTGHEMLHEFDLVHMGGRLYDPQLARFLSPDPFVQFPKNTQNYNRYSYVLNNPLSNTDPSGYFIQLIPALLFAAKLISGTAMIVATMITSFASVLIAGGSFGDAFKAALIAGASAVVASSVGGYFDTLGAVEGANSSLVELSRAMTHGMTSGGFSELGGGDFQSGFMAGFAGSLGGSMMGARSGEGQLFSNKGARVVGAAIVGGTASELGGGKFVNGAVTAAIIQIFNGENHRVEDQEMKGLTEVVAPADGYENRMQIADSSFTVDEMDALKSSVVAANYVLRQEEASYRISLYQAVDLASAEDALAYLSANADSIASVVWVGHGHRGEIMFYGQPERIDRIVSWIRGGGSTTSGVGNRIPIVNGEGCWDGTRGITTTNVAITGRMMDSRHGYMYHLYAKSQEIERGAN